MKKSGTRGFLWAVAFGFLLASTAANAQEVRMLNSGQSLYLPIYSHIVFGNVGRSGTPSQVLLSALVGTPSTHPWRPLLSSHHAAKTVSTLSTALCIFSAALPCFNPSIRPDLRITQKSHPG